MTAVRERGAKIIVYHGVSDPIFSVADTEPWYRGSTARPAATPTTSRASTACPAWATARRPGHRPVRLPRPAGGLGRARQRAGRIAQARGAGNPGGANAECRPAGRRPHAAAVPLPVGRALQRPRRRRERVELGLQRPPRSGPRSKSRPRPRSRRLRRPLRVPRRDNGAMPATKTTLYLASQSPRRSQLLQQIGAAHRLLTPAYDEDAECWRRCGPANCPRPTCNG